MVLVVVGIASGAVTTKAETYQEDTTQAIHVNCNGGQSLARVVKHVREGQTILISGTCHERVLNQDTETDACWGKVSP